MKLDEAWPLLEALKAGKTVQFKAFGEWIGYKGDPAAIAASILTTSNEVRLKPTPRTVPLGPGDFPPGSVLRWPEWSQGCYVSITQVLIDGAVASGVLHKFSDLKDSGAFRSTDRGATWLPCSKEVE